MKSFLFLPIIVAAGSVVVGCQSPSGNSTATGPIKVEFKTFSRHFCETESKCADFRITYPVFSGDTAKYSAFFIGFNPYIKQMSGASPDLEIEAGLEQAAANFISGFSQTLHADPQKPAYWNVRLESKFPLITDKVLSYEIIQNSNVGDTPPLTTISLSTYEVASGKFLRIEDMVKDPKALVPMLEKAFKKIERMPEDRDLTPILNPRYQSFPPPFNVMVLPEGIRCFYNWYEVVTEPMDNADILLTWEQLGDQADKKRWID